ncbi:hypothetical protein Nepgr_026921 [Nepenthes gracilis]|uniref:Uncharacterized protein n=1 Tax=Nepenthes gracilis TaxID=150966 RepID=A0AAD3Y108_NEPGR|nr:hypothetical protein Nepgr_026921 [Nepenthes gracilis]
MRRFIQCEYCGGLGDCRIVKHSTISIYEDGRPQRTEFRNRNSENEDAREENSEVARVTETISNAADGRPQLPGFLKIEIQNASEDARDRS